MKILFMSLLAATVLTTAALGQGPVATGGEFQVNTTTANAQRWPSATRLADGGFITVWYSFGSGGTDNSTNSIQAQRFDVEGNPLGGEFQVNSYTDGSQTFPAVASFPDGGFVVVWDSVGSNGSDSQFVSIQGQRYTADAMPLGEQFQINTYTTSSQLVPVVATFADGGFVTVWESRGSSGTDPFGSSIQGQRYDADGTPVGEEFQVNTYTPSFQNFPAVASLANGGFVATWHSSGSAGSDTSGMSIQARRFDADGRALGEDFQVNTDTVGDQQFPTITALPTGGFVIAWHGGSSASDTSGTSVQAQLYAADGVALGDQFRIHSTTAGNQTFPDLATWESGFVATWQSAHSSGSDFLGESIQSRLFAADGTPLGGEVEVNSTIIGDQEFPSVTALAKGELAVLWESPTSGGSDLTLSIQGQRLDAPRFALADPSGRCLAVDSEASAPARLSRCDGDESQQWRLDLTHLTQKISSADSRCLAAGTADATGNIPVILTLCDAADLWQLANPDHAEQSLLMHAETGWCLDAGGANRDGGAPARLVACHSNADQLWRPAAATCTRDSLGLCLAGERFRIDLDWRSFDGTTGSSQVVPRVSTDDSGLLWFFQVDNWEMLIKVLDGCDINNRFWVFAAATTNVEYNLRVTDTATGVVREYSNPLGLAADAITDTDAFATCSIARRTADRRSKKTAPIRTDDPIQEGVCVPSATRLCLNDFSVEIAWANGAGGKGDGHAVEAGSDSTGMFWFFSPNNWEMLVKVLDGCDINDNFWLLAAATTDVEYTLRVTDMASGTSRQYFNPLGQAAPALIDTFPTCP